MIGLIWLDERDALALHDQLLARHGGRAGVRDMGLLSSALARPRQLEAYGTPGLTQMAAALTAGIIRNHPFIDGNKRVGFVAGLLFLELNGGRYQALEEDATRAVMALASGEADEAAYAAHLAANTTFPP